MGEKKPDCYKCLYRGCVPGSCHSTCSNESAEVEGDPYGRKRGWFYWPYDFDPAWLISCDGFKPGKGILDADSTKGNGDTEVG